MKRLWAVVAVLALLLCASGVWAANSVVVESRTLATNAVDCPIHISFSNDAELQGVVVPLVVREVTAGTFVSSLRLSWDDRLHAGGPLADILYTQIFSDPLGTCRAGGFAQPYASNDTLKHAVGASPEGLRFVAIKIFGPYLAPGSDVTGSMVLSVDVTGPAGTFEIDTTCIDPASHLDFVLATSQAITPSFTKGVITTEINTAPTALCQDVTVSTGAGCVAEASIDAGSFDPDGGAVTLIQDPPGPYPMGQTLVELTVIDALCATDVCSAVVTVVDDVPPVVSCPADTVVVVEPGQTGAVVEFAFSASDECSSVNTISIPPSGTFFQPGVTPVQCIASDAVGNADTCTFYVAVGASGYCNDRPIDVNCDGQLDVFDMMDVINVLFGGAPEPGPCCNIEN